MRWLYTAALLALSGCGRPCEGYCVNLSVVYEDLGQGQETTGLPGWHNDAFDASAYEAACEEAPSGRSCEECTAWYQEVFLEPMNISSSCDSAYGRYDEDDPEYAALAEEECEQTCRAEGMRY